MDVLFLRATGFFCNWKPRDRKIVVFDNKKKNFAGNFFKFLVFRILDPDPDRYSTLNAGSGSVSNEYGSETLILLY
jgi:hypothetical protein